MSEDERPPEELDSTELPPTETTPATAGVGERIGPYRLLQKLGEGGMGEVYEAQQEQPVRRRVAVKLIKPGMDSKQVLARFESERQALALMNHPAVAKVFDAGTTEQGRPYFAMEYVKGEPITAYCDRHRLTTRERLDLFMQVCEGVQHAHQKGIIHRDLKPSNVLVTIQDDKPVPKIIDFGVAKATEQRLTEKTVFTQMGVRIGTPEYMSPEQAEMTGLDIDTRTDVYSLGVMLYELLIGALPFDSKELRRVGSDGRCTRSWLSGIRRVPGLHDRACRRARTITCHLSAAKSPVKYNHRLTSQHGGHSMTSRVGVGACIVFLIVVAGCGADQEAALSNISALGESGDVSDGEYAYLIDKLENGRGEERPIAAWALGEIGRPEAVPKLIEALGDKDFHLRLNACGALGQYDGKEVQAALTQSLDDVETQVAAAALRGLSRSEFSSAAVAIGKVIDGDNETLRPLAVQALSKMASVENFAVFERLTEDPDTDVRIMAVFTLGGLRDSRATPRLIELLEDEAWEVRANAAQALGMIGDPSARPHLEKLPGDIDQHEQVQIAAELALERLPG